MTPYFQPRNFTIMPRTGLTYAGRRRLRGLGMNPHQSGDTISPIIGPGFRSLVQPGAPAAAPLARVATVSVVPSPAPAPQFVPYACPAWGCGPAPIRTVYPAAPSTPAPAPAGGSSPQQVAGTPVPAGYNLNSVFIASDGTQWEYSTGQGKWINVGIPYNLNAASAPIPPAVTPVDTTAALTAGSGAAPVTIAPAPPADAWSSLINWLPETNLLPPVPNWILMVCFGFLALKFMQPAQTGRR